MAVTSRRIVHTLPRSPQVRGRGGATVNLGPAGWRVRRGLRTPTGAWFGRSPIPGGRRIGVFRSVAILVVGLVVQILVTSSLPCCCVRALQRPESKSVASKSGSSPVRRCSCCRKSRTTEKKEGHAPDSHSDCACKPGEIVTFETGIGTDLSSARAPIPVFDVVWVVWALDPGVPSIALAHDSGPPFAPSSASPTLLPVLRI